MGPNSSEAVFGQRHQVPEPVFPTSFLQTLFYALILLNSEFLWIFTTISIRLKLSPEGLNHIQYVVLKGKDLK